MLFLIDDFQWRHFEKDEHTRDTTPNVKCVWMILVPSTGKRSGMKSGAELRGLNDNIIQVLISGGDNLGKIRELVKVCVPVREHLASVQGRSGNYGAAVALIVS